MTRKDNAWLQNILLKGILPPFSRSLVTLGMECTLRKRMLDRLLSPSPSQAQKICVSCELATVARWNHRAAKCDSSTVESWEGPHELEEKGCGAVLVKLCDVLNGNTAQSLSPLSMGIFTNNEDNIIDVNPDHSDDVTHVSSNTGVTSVQLLDTHNSSTCRPEPTQARARGACSFHSYSH